MFEFIKSKIYGLARMLLFRCFPESEYIIGCQTNMFIKNNYNKSKISSNVAIHPPSTIYCSSIDSFTYLSSNAYVAYTHIGKFCSIGPNLTCGRGMHPVNVISTSPMFYSSRKSIGFTLSQTNKFCECPEIVIGNDVFIGANVTILNGVKIGDGAVVGAGAVVTKDVAPYAIVVGCPAKVIKYRFRGDQIDKLKKIKWWDFSMEKLKEIEKYEFQIDDFLNLYKDFCE